MALESWLQYKDQRKQLEEERKRRASEELERILAAQQ
jgi:hypothetical protein